MEFSTLSQFFFRIENTASRNEMTVVLADLFTRCEKTEIDKICYLLQGRVAPLFTAVEFGMADKTMIKIVSRAFNKNEAEIKASFKKIGDLGIVAQKCCDYEKHKGVFCTVNEVFEKLFAAATATGNGSVERKINILAKLLQSLDPLSVKYIVRIPLAKLRLGFSDMTILDGLSWMLSGSKKDRKQIEDAYNVRPDLGFIAKQVKIKGLSGVKKITPEVGTPVLMAKAERLGNTKEIIEKLGKCAVEYKYDGFRIQMHYSKTKLPFRQLKSFGQEQSLFAEEEPNLHVKLFSRNLEDVTKMYPDIIRGAMEQIKTDSVILEGEAIAFDPATLEFLPFQDTVQRKRKYDIGQKAREIPLKLIAFDILSLNGKSLLQTPFLERRRLLEALFKD